MAALSYKHQIRLRVATQNKYLNMLVRAQYSVAIQTLIKIPEQKCAIPSCFLFCFCGQ